MNRINLLYNYIHNGLHEDYEIYPININKIKPDDIEMINNNIYVDEIVKQNLQFLFTIDNDIYFKIISDNLSSLVKLSLSKKSYNDNYISYILSELVLANKTKHILLPIFNSKIEINKIKKLLNSIDLPDIYNNILEKNKNIKINLKLRECFYNITTLKKYFNDINIKISNGNNIGGDIYINYKLLLFKIIHTLLIIKTKYVHFLHNNLILDNIFVYINKEIIPKDYEEYKYNNVIYYLPYEIFEIKITNFENSTINLSESENKNDLIVLADDILKLNKNIDLSSKIFLTKLRDMKNNNIENLLNDEYFNELKEKKVNKSKSFNGIRNITTTLDSDHESVLGQQFKINRRYVKKMLGGYDKQSASLYKNEKNDPFKTNDERNTSKKAQDDPQPTKTPPIMLEQKVYDTSKPAIPPPYKSEKNDPFKKKDERDTFKKDDRDTFKKEVSQPLLLDQKVYDVSKIPKQEPPPAYVPLYDTTGESFAMPFTNIPNPAYNKPMQKVYNISLANPLHDFTTVSRVNEDIIPGDPRSFSFTTTYERIQLINFMRNLINDNIDGESMNVTGGKNTLLSSIKLLQLNPYSLDRNPYMDLGHNFLIYNAAYPIRYDEAKNNIFISKNAHGVNVRLYPLSIGEMKGNELKINIDNIDYDLWRELKYYNYIRDNIVKNKKSPNFITPILYKTDNLSNVHWSKLAEIQKKRLFDVKKNNNFVFLDDKKLEIYILEKINDTSFNSEISKIELILEPHKDNIKIIKLNFSHPDYIPITNKFNVKSYPFIIFKYDHKYDPYDIKKYRMDAPDIISYVRKNILSLEGIDITASTGKSLILLTEAPNTNFIKWASPVYQTSGSLKKMISTGFHKKEVWESVLFQLMHIIYVLQEECIYFDELSLKNNIYIKDLYYEPNTTNYWIYTIDELDYYVPNYGYLVLFDSKYSDIESKDFKIKSHKLFIDKNDKINKTIDSIAKIDDTTVKALIFNKFKSIFNRDVFNTELKLQGGLPPEDNILNLLSGIYNNIDSNIKNYFYLFFKKYLNNRTGTFLMKTEKELVNLANRPFFKKGELLIKIDRYGEYKWVIFKSTNTTNSNIKEIINTDANNNMIEEKVNQLSLIKYPLAENIMPNNITETNIIEQFHY